MPLGNSASCVDACGTAIADYILSWEQSLQGKTLWAINIGGAAVTAADGQIYQNDNDYLQGSEGTTTEAISATATPKLYQSGRWDKVLAYELPVNDGQYDVTLSLAETYWKESGKRIVDIYIEDTKVASNFDIFAAAGYNVALDKKFTNIPVFDGALSIRLESSVDNATLNAIRVQGGEPLYTEFSADAARVGPMPLRRLTLQEYDNTIKDLLKTTATASRLTDFPATQKSDFAYPRRADALSIFETTKYQESAEVLARLANLKQLISCSSNDKNCASQFIQSFSQKAFRRPLTTEEINNLLAIYDAAIVNSSSQLAFDESNAFPYCASTNADPDGDGWGKENDSNCIVSGSSADFGRNGTASSNSAVFDEAIRWVINAILQSPKFLYRWELSDANAVKEGQFIKLNGYEMASRLSYFIWKSMPDDALLNAAKTGQLDNATGIKQQATRLLNDPRAAESIAYFPEYWLDYSKLESVAKNNAVYPEFTEALKTAMLEESRLFATNIILKGDATFHFFLTSRESFVNQTLAAVYGLNGSFNNNYEPVQLDANERSGILTRAAFLAAKGAADGSNPPKRGADVYKQVMCGIVPNPPAIIPEPEPASAGGTTRQRFEDHANNSCATVCHSRFDPIGFSFEGFGGIGEYRLFDNDLPVDASGSIELAGSHFTFNDANDLSEIYANSAEVKACFAKQWLRYALDRNEDKNLDAPTVTALETMFVNSTGNIKTLIEEIVSSRSFRYRVPSVGENQ